MIEDLDVLQAYLPRIELPEKAQSIGVYTFFALGNPFPNSDLPAVLRDDPRVQVTTCWSKITPKGFSLILDRKQMPPDRLVHVLSQRASRNDLSIAFCISAGGITGFNAALAAKFDIVVGISAITLVTGDTIPPSSRWTRIVPDLEAEYRNHFPMDLGKRFSEVGFAGDLHLVFADRNERDVAQALHLAEHHDSRLYPVPARKHTFWPNPDGPRSGAWQLIGMCLGEGYAPTP